MSQVLYLVQLLPCFRFHYESGTERTLCLGVEAQAFSSQNEAQTWIENTAPVNFNPFVGIYEDEDDFSLNPLWDSADEDDEITAGAMNNFLVSLGVTSPL